MLQLTGVLDGGDTSAKVGTRHGPASLGDPDPLAGRDTVNYRFLKRISVNAPHGRTRVS
jgi:hypothetical protein